MNNNPKNKATAFMAHPMVGTSLTVISGLSFLFLCMLLPLVGKAGAVTPFAHRNYLAFLGYLLLTLVLCGFAISSKMMYRRITRSPPPFFTMALAGICCVLLVALLTGLLSV